MEPFRMSSLIKQGAVREKQHDVKVPFTRPFTEITGTSPLKRRNGNMSISYLRQAASRRKQCNMTNNAHC
jgi:hypothetical protein